MRESFRHKLICLFLSCFVLTLLMVIKTNIISNKSEVWKPECIPPSQKNSTEEIDNQNQKPADQVFGGVSIFSLEQDDPRLIQYVRNLLTPPSELPLQFNESEWHYMPNKYSEYVLNIFKNKGKNFTGTFVEAGGYDGVRGSNTLYLEYKGWKGVLIEPNSFLIPKLLSRNRKAWISTSCLAHTTKAEVVNLTSLKEWPDSAQLDKPLTIKEMWQHGLGWAAKQNLTWHTFEVTCFPLYTILKAALEFKSIDFLSLDIQGLEMKVLKSFPFHKMKIRTIIVEIFSFPEKERSDFRSFMNKKGYDYKETIGYGDDVFILRGEF